MYRGRSGLTSLFRRLLPWMSAGDRPRALRAYLVLITAYGVSVATYLLLGKLTGQPREIQQVQDILGNSLSLGALIIVGGLFLDEGGTLEELGWRGFAMPLLQQQYTPLVAAVILGILWWAWHFPREIATLPENYDSLAFWGLQA
ncbi:MAG: CPBP family intramembrane metalloprotease, partial [Lysobacterales bacterium]